MAVLADQTGYSGVTFLAGILLARTCSKAEYGYFILGMSIVFAGDVILRSLISIPYSVLCHGRDEMSRRIYAGHCLLEQMALSLGLVGIFGLSYWIIGWTGRNSELTVWMLWFSIAAVWIHLRGMIRSIVLADIRVWKNMITGLLVNLLTGLGLLGLYAWGRLTMGTAILILAAGGAVFVAVSLRFHSAILSIHRDGFLDDCLANWNYGKWILTATGVNLLGIRIFPWLTLLWWDSQTVAIVGVLSMMACAIRPAIQAGMSYLIPGLARQAHLLGRSEAISQGLWVAGLAAVLGLFFIAGMGLFGGILIRILYTDQYDGHRLSLLLFSTAMALKAVDVPIRAGLTAVRNPKAISISTIIATLAALVCALFLIPRFGVVGVAISVLIHSLGCMAVNLTYIVALQKTTAVSHPAESRNLRKTTYARPSYRPS